jgi:hypothetical protein
MLVEQLNVETTAVVRSEELFRVIEFTSNDAFLLNNHKINVAFVRRRIDGRAKEVDCAAYLMLSHNATHRRKGDASVHSRFRLIISLMAFGN